MQPRRAAILAGGSSSRMGSPKSELPVGSTTFLGTLVERLRASFDDVVVCGGTVAPVGCTLLPDPIPDAGPLSGVVSALDHKAGGDTFIVGVDMPLISDATIGLLTGPALLSEQARVARVNGRIQPVCGMYSEQLLPLAWARLSSDDRSMMGFLRRVPILSPIDITDGSLANVNSPEDYERLLARTDR